MAEVKDLSGNGGRSDPTFTNDRSGRPEAPLVVDGSSTGGNTTEQQIVTNQTSGSQKTQIVDGGGLGYSAGAAGGGAVGPGQFVFPTRAYGMVFDETNFYAVRGNVTGTFVVTKGGANLNTGQVAVGTTATLVVAARAGRQKVTLSPTSSVVYYVGGPSVSSTAGLYVAAGGTITLDTAAAVYCAGASAFTQTFIEYF